MARISEINIGQRFRKDIGDLEPLKQSIEELGLLQPIGVDANNNLIFGYRRLKACEELGMEEIDTITIDDLDDGDELLAEHDENEIRKKFTRSERVAIYKAIKEKFGKERRRGRPSKEEVLDFSTEKNVGNCPPFLKNEKNREIAAKKSGFEDSRTARRAEAVVDSEDDELIKMMDNDEVSVSAASDVAKLPIKERKQVVSQGSEAIKIKSREIRSKSSARRAQTVIENGIDELNTWVNDGVISVSAAEKIARLSEQKQKEFIELGPKAAVTKLRYEEQLDKEAEAPTPDEVYFMRDQPQLGRSRWDRDLAAWVWNPITGCRHGCKDCHARPIAQRVREDVDPRHRFDCMLWRERLDTPYNLKEITPDNDPAARTIQLCTHGDMFGQWVSSEWIEDVLYVIKNTKDLTYIVSTRNPARLQDFSIPANCWVGAVITQSDEIDQYAPIIKSLTTNVRFWDLILDHTIIPDFSCVDWIRIRHSSSNPATETVFLMADGDMTPLYMRESVFIRSTQRPRV